MFARCFGMLKAGLYQLGSRGGSLKKKKKKNEPGRLGTTQRELVPTCLVKSVSHWNTLYTTKTSQTDQATSSLQRPLDPSTSGWLLLLFLYIPDGTSPSSCCTLDQTILRPVKQSSPALSTARTIGLMPFLAILENVSGYSLHWKNKNKQKRARQRLKKIGTRGFSK